MSDEPEFVRKAPEVTPEPDWTPLPGAVFKWRGKTFVSGDPDGDRLRVKYFVRERDTRLFGKAWFGPNTIGPPGHAHGGSMAAVLDEAMGFAAWVAGHAVLAAKITIEFHNMLPIGTDATLEAWVEEKDGRKVMVKGRIKDPDSGKSFAEGEGLFITLKGEHLELFRSAAEEEHPEKKAWG